MITTLEGNLKISNSGRQFVVNCAAHGDRDMVSHAVRNTPRTPFLRELVKLQRQFGE